MKFIDDVGYAFDHVSQGFMGTIRHLQTPSKRLTKKRVKLHQFIVYTYTTLQWLGGLYMMKAILLLLSDLLLD